MINQESRLETWSILLSKEIVNCWINEKSEMPYFNKFLSILNALKVLDNPNLLTELEAKFQSIKKENQSQPGLEKLIEIQKDISDYYFDVCLKKNTLNFQPSIIEIKDNFENFINSFWLETPPKATLDFLAKIEKILFTYYNQYQKENQSLLSEENAGKKSYNFLTYKIIHKQNNLNFKDNCESANNLLLHIHRRKMQSEICELKLQIIKNLLQSNKLIIENLITSNSFLVKLKDSFLIQHQPSNLLLPILFEKICSIKSPETFRRELEKDLGVSINRWGNCGYISLEEVKTILSTKVINIAKNIYAELLQELVSEVKLNQEENNHFHILAATN